MYRSLGVEANAPTKHYGNKKSCANNNNECESRNSSMSFHKMKGLVAVEIIATHHACSEENISDMLTKFLEIEIHNNLINRVFN